MKILYIALKYENGIPSRRYSFEHYNFYDSLVKMNDGSHEIVYFPFDEIMLVRGRAGMNKELLETVEREKPDLCFFFLFTDEIFKATIKKITETSGAITFNWFADDHWRFHTFSKHYAPLFHYVATTDSEAPKRYERQGYKNAIKTQWACNHFLYHPIKGEVRHTVSFVGNPHGKRKEVMDELVKAGLPVSVRGNGWPDGQVSQQGMLEIFSQSAINLNLTKSSYGFDWKTPGRVVVGRRSSGQIRLLPITESIDAIRTLFLPKRDQIKGRNFEIPGCGGFLLTPPADNIHEYYTPDKEIVLFNNTDELIEKAQYYLDHEEERKAIAQAGYERTLREHTYEKRFNEIFKIMGLEK